MRTIKKILKNILNIRFCSFRWRNIDTLKTDILFKIIRTICLVISFQIISFPFRVQFCPRDINEQNCYFVFYLHEDFQLK